MPLPGEEARRVQVVASDPASPLAVGLLSTLERAGHKPDIVGPDLSSGAGAKLLVDDEGLQEALARLVRLAPGQVNFPNVIIVTGQVSEASGLLAEGLRDVVEPGDAARAVEALQRGRPPIRLSRLRDEIRLERLPRIVEELRQTALRRDALLEECVDLVRAGASLQGRIDRLRRWLDEQSIDELLVQQGVNALYLDQLSALRAPRLGALPEPPALRPDDVLAKREPRHRRAREQLDEAIEWLRQDGLLAAVGSAGAEALAEIARTSRSRPLQGMRDCQSLVDRELAGRLQRIRELAATADPVAALEQRCLEPCGLRVLAPGLAVPEGVRLVLRSLAQPPAEVCESYCLDLRTLTLRRCGEVLEEIARSRAQGSESNRWTPNPAAGAGWSATEGRAS